MGKKRGIKFLKEFKEFALKGNVVDLAVGVIIGAAFKAIVDSLVNDILMPLLSLFWSAENLADIAVTLPNGNALTYGNFIGAVINFIIMSFVIFLFVKFITGLRKRFERVEEVVEEATTKQCPYCKTDIDKDATRCPNCTSNVD